MLLEDMLAVCGDRKNEPAYRKLIKQYPMPLLRTALSETHHAHLEGRILKTKGAYFTDTVKRLSELRKQQSQ
jgi:hypothetical protein